MKSTLFEDIGCLIIIAAILIFSGIYIYFDWITPNYEEYKVEITYCDNRPTEIKSYIVESGLPPEIITRKQAVPILCFCERGVQSVRVLNVCEFKIISQRYISE